jgi:hypothetical protein
LASTTEETTANTDWHITCLWRGARHLVYRHSYNCFTSSQTPTIQCATFLAPLIAPRDHSRVVHAPLRHPFLQVRTLHFRLLVHHVPCVTTPHPYQTSQIYRFHWSISERQPFFSCDSALAPKWPGILYKWKYA